MSNDKEEVIKMFIFNESRTLVLDKKGNNYRVYLFDALMGKLNVERFSLLLLEKAKNVFDIRKNCPNPRLKSSFISKIKQSK